MMNQDGQFGQYGGSYIPEILFNSQQELLKAYQDAMADPAFIAEVKISSSIIPAGQHR